MGGDSGGRRRIARRRPGHADPCERTRIKDRIAGSAVPALQTRAVREVTMVDRRLAVVTGASSGIGREAALALLRDNFRVVGTGRDEARIAAVEAGVAAGRVGERFAMLRADLSLMGD